MTLSDFLPNAKQWRSIATHSVTYVAGAVTFGAGIGAITADEAHNLTIAFNQFINGVTNAYGGASAFIGILATIYAARANSRKAQATAMATEINANAATPVIVKPN